MIDTGRYPFYFYDKNEDTYETIAISIHSAVIDVGL